MHLGLKIIFVFALCVLVTHTYTVYNTANLVPVTDHCDREYVYEDVVLETSRIAGYSSCNDRFRYLQRSDLMLFVSEDGKVYMYDTGCLYSKPILDISANGDGQVSNNTYAMDITCNWDGHYPKFYVLYVQKNAYSPYPAIAHVDEYVIVADDIDGNFYPNVVFSRRIISLRQEDVYKESHPPDVTETKNDIGFIAHMSHPISKLGVYWSKNASVYYNPQDGVYESTCYALRNDVVGVKLHNKHNIISLTRGIDMEFEPVESVKMDKRHVHHSKYKKTAQEMRLGRHRTAARLKARPGSNTYKLARSVATGTPVDTDGLYSLMAAETANRKCKNRNARIHSRENAETMHNIPPNIELYSCSRMFNRLQFFGRKICGPGYENCPNITVNNQNKFQPMPGKPLDTQMCYSALSFDPYSRTDYSESYCGVQNGYSLCSGIVYRDEELNALPKLMLFVENDVEYTQSDNCGETGTISPQFKLKKVVRDHGRGGWVSYNVDVETQYNTNIYPDILASSVPKETRFLIGRTTAYCGEKKLPIKIYKIIENINISYQNKNKMYTTKRLTCSVYMHLS